MPLIEFYAAPKGTYGNAVLNWEKHAPSDLVAYALSYHNAAHNLIACKERLEFGSIDHGACPIIYLYRHSIELYLKAMIYRVACLSITDDELRTVLPRLWREHSLIRLLDMVSPIFETKNSRFAANLGNLRENTLEFLSNLEKIDGRSYSFRYPINTAGHSSLPDTLLVNIFVFAENADAVLLHLKDACRYLLREVLNSSPQMRLGLTTLLNNKHSTV